MGKFDGLLLVSDYDNTLRYTEIALVDGSEPPPVPERNIAALKRWMAQGGKFAVATGRSLAAFHQHATTFPTNAPCVVDNGASIYDLTTGKYLMETQLPHASVERVAEVLEKFPDISTEIYIPGDQVLTLRPTAWTDLHAKLTGAQYTILEKLEPEKITQHIFKALFVGEHSRLEEVWKYMDQRGWNEDWELVYSRENLLEMTAPGANKALACRKLQKMCGCHTLIAIGDGTNDISMLTEADRAFAPANASPEVLAMGAEPVCHCIDGAVADAIERMEAE